MNLVALSAWLLNTPVKAPNCSQHDRTSEWYSRGSQLHSVQSKCIQGVSRGFGLCCFPLSCRGSPPGPVIAQSQSKPLCAILTMREGLSLTPGGWGLSVSYFQGPVLYMAYSRSSVHQCYMDEC